MSFVTGFARFDLASALSRDEEREVEAQLRAGALVIYPTDTLYAIGCRALDGAAVNRLRAAKRRDDAKALPVIASDLDQARSLTSHWPEDAQRLASAFWPGPLTLIVPASSSLPASLLAGGNSIAVRVPAAASARWLSGLAGPLVSTSANLAGEAPCVTVDMAIEAFPSASIGFDIGRLDGEPSTIVDVCVPGAPRVVRAGRVDAASIERALRP